MRRLGGCRGLHGLNQQGGGLQWIVSALPCFPEDPLFTLLPLPWDRVEVLSIEIGMSAGAKPPTTYRVTTEDVLKVWGFHTETAQLNTRWTLAFTPLEFITFIYFLFPCLGVWVCACHSGYEG